MSNTLIFQYHLVGKQMHTNTFTLTKSHNIALTLRGASNAGGTEGRKADACIVFNIARLDDYT